ncbi:hypothetical protein D3C78_988820 [compost metagenome]
MAAGNEEAGIALGTGLQHLLQGEHLAGAEQAVHDGADARHRLRVAAKVLGIDGTLVGNGPVPSRCHRGQGVTGLQQGGGRNPQFILVEAGGQALAPLQRQCGLAREQNQDLSLGRRAGRGRGRQQQ